MWKKLLKFVKSLFSKPAKEIHSSKIVTKEIVVPQHEKTFKEKVFHRHNNRKRTPGRNVQVVRVIAKPSYIVDVPEMIEGNPVILNGMKLMKKIWMPAKYKTRVIYH